MRNASLTSIMMMALATAAPARAAEVQPHPGLWHYLGQGTANSAESIFFVRQSNRHPSGFGERGIVLRVLSAPQCDDFISTHKRSLDRAIARRIAKGDLPIYASDDRAKRGVLAVRSGDVQALRLEEMARSETSPKGEVISTSIDCENRTTTLPKLPRDVVLPARASDMIAHLYCPL